MQRPSKTLFVVSVIFSFAVGVAGSSIYWVIMQAGKTSMLVIEELIEQTSSDFATLEKHRILSKREFRQSLIEEIDLDIEILNHEIDNFNDAPFNDGIVRFYKSRLEDYKKSYKKLVIGEHHSVR